MTKPTTHTHYNTTKSVGGQPTKIKPNTEEPTHIRNYISQISIMTKPTSNHTCKPLKYRIHKQQHDDTNYIIYRNPA